MKRIILFTQQYPHYLFPYRGLFNFSIHKTLINQGYDVIALVPFNILPPPSLRRNIVKLVKYYFSLIKHNNKNEDFIVEYLLTINFANKFLWKYNHILLRIFNSKNINRIFSEFKPELVLTSFINPSAMYIKFLKNRCEFVVTSFMIGSDILIHPDKYNGWEKIEKILNKYIDHNICVSKSMYEYVKKNRNINNLTYIHNGYDSNGFYFDNSVSQCCSETKIKLVSVGSFYKVKGHDILLKTMQNLPKNYSLSLVGTGDLMSNYIDIIRKSNLTDRVTILGRVEDLRTVLLNHDFFVLPSRSEGLPIAILEANACGLPVIASKVGGVSEVVKEYFNGLLFEPENADDLAVKIIKASNVNWNRREIAIFTSRNFSWVAWVQKLEKLVGIRREI